MNPYDTHYEDVDQYWVERLGRRWYLFCSEDSQPIAEFDTPNQAHNELARRTGRRDYDC